jgi:hypothetical protein
MQQSEIIQNPANANIRNDRQDEAQRIKYEAWTWQLPSRRTFNLTFWHQQSTSDSLLLVART